MARKRNEGNEWIIFIVIIILLIVVFTYLTGKTP